MSKSRKQPRAKDVAIPRPRSIAMELNFLPDRYRSRGLRILTTMRPWLFLAGFALLLIPSAQLFRRQGMQLARVEKDFATVSEALEGYQPLADERSQLEARIASSQTQIIEIRAAYDTVDIREVTWSEMVPLIMAQVPDGIELTHITQSDEEVVLEGLAETYPDPSVLADNLEALNQFESVAIEYVVLVQLDGQPDEPAPAAPVMPSEAEQPIEIIATDELSPALYRFKISVILPLFVELAPESVDES